MVLEVQETCWQFRSKRLGRRETGWHWNGDYYQDRRGLPRNILVFSNKRLSPICFNEIQPTVYRFRTRTTRIRTLESEIKLMYHITNSEQRNRNLVCMDSCARNVGLLRKYIPLVVVVNIYLFCV